MNSQIFSLFVFLVTASFVTSLKAPIISTSVGQLHGLYIDRENGIRSNQYLGVPYAKPPTGHLRFKLPQSLADSANEDRDATDYSPVCLQMKHLKEVINPLLDIEQEHMVSEDCLYLNIYVPVLNDTNSSATFPVMVWLPGEGFDFADARQFDGTYLASTNNVIVVTVQYRVGVFGFLKSGSLASGNMGLWDQIEALKWIKRNIRAFGGDLNNVTLFGRFSGSMSISALLTSKVLRASQEYDLPLFNRAIMMSGVAVGNWVFEKEPEKKAADLITSLGCNSASDVFECLATIPATSILEKSSFGWKPVIDGYLIDQQPITALSHGQFASGVSEVMMGSTEGEGSLCLLTHFATKSKFYEKILNDEVTAGDLMKMMDLDLKMFLGESLQSTEVLPYISSVMSSSKSSSLRDIYMDFCSNLLIQNHMKAFGDLIPKSVDVFTYKFSYRPSYSLGPSFLNSAIHGDDVLMAFGLTYAHPGKTDADIEVTQKFMKYLNNFVSFGNPNGNFGSKDGTQPIWSRHRTMVIDSKQKFASWTGASSSASLFKGNKEVLITLITTIATILVMVLVALLITYKPDNVEEPRRRLFSLCRKTSVM